ncbi:hypothetical protein DdX_18760 [Ditylenchus destructor]|uniref:F-box domain-containing protein n=1 Tax=Ditylenchus destructor TaxID=166010 RepID=A0AAD4MLP9_9BILA|nr:hypothetical protein DdX_18760 [Ditylenchus destructor]
MDDDILIDVFRLLSRRQLSQSVELSCRRFRRLVNSPAVPNLNVIHVMSLYLRTSKGFLGRLRKEWGFDISGAADGDFIERISISYKQLQSTHRPPQYLRFGFITVGTSSMAKEKWRKCLWEFRHCFLDCILRAYVSGMSTAVEVQSFLADQLLPLFPNSAYEIHVRSCPYDVGSLKEACYSPPLLLTSNPSILNCMCVAILTWKRYECRYDIPFLAEDDVVEWLHHVPTVPTTTRMINWFSKSTRNLCLLAPILQFHGNVNGNFGVYVDAVDSLVEKIKKKFLLASTSEEMRQFYLVLKYVEDMTGHSHLTEFDIRNDATNERLTLKVTHERGCYFVRSSCTYELKRE